MLQKRLIRPKSCENILLMPVKAELNKDSKILITNEVENYFKKIENKQLIKTKIKENKKDPSSFLSYKSQLLLNNVKNHYSTLNSSNTENNSVKFNNSKISLVIKNSNSFYAEPKLKSQTFRKNKYLKLSGKTKVISLKKSYLTNNEEIKMDKEELLLAAYKNNPVPLLESIHRNTNCDKKMLSQRINNGSIKDNKKKLLDLIRKKREKSKDKIKEEKNEDKQLILSNGNFKKSYKESFYNKYTSKKIFDISNNKKNVEHCIAINTTYLNPYLQNLDDSNYKLRNRFYRSKTENVDDIQNFVNMQKIEENNKNFYLNILKNTEFNNLDQKPENTMNKSQIIENNNNLNKKKKYADASSDTGLDNVVPNNFKKVYNNSLNKIVKKNLRMNCLNKCENNNDRNKVYAPKTKIFKYNKFSKNRKREDKKCNNLNISLKKAVKLYNFNNVINLFDKKISFDNKAKMNQTNNFRKRKNKHYSSSNNVNVNYLRKKNFLGLKKNKSLYHLLPQITKDSNMDLYDFDAFFIKRL